MPVDPQIANGLIPFGEGVARSMAAGAELADRRRQTDLYQNRLALEDQRLKQETQDAAEKEDFLRTYGALKAGIPGALEYAMGKVSKMAPQLVQDPRFAEFAALPPEQKRKQLVEWWAPIVGDKPAEADVPGSYKEWRLAKDDPTGYGKFLEGKQPKGTSVNLTVNTEEGFYGSLAKKSGEQFAGLADAAQSAPQRIDSANRVLALLDRNPYTGAAADWKLGFGKAAKAAGFDYAGDDISNTEALASELASATLDAIKSSGLGSGQGFTDKDRQFLEKARAGNITLDDKTLRRLAILNKRAGEQTIQRYNEQAGRLKKEQLDVIGYPQKIEVGGWSVEPLP